MRFVNDRLAVGSSHDGRNEEGLRLAGITAAVNVAVDLDMVPYDLIVGKKAGLICGPGNRLEDFKVAVELVLSLLKFHQKVAIFCHSGRDRSPTVASAVLAVLENLSYATAYQHVRDALGNVKYTSDEVEAAFVVLTEAWERERHVGQLKVSVMMPCFNRPELSERCLRSIRTNTRYSPLEVIGVDDGSTDPSVGRVLDTYCDKVIRHETNEGIAKSRADGVDAATGDLLCAIDNDIVVFPGWLEALVDCLLNGDRIAIVAPLGSFNAAYFAERIADMDDRGLFPVAEVGTYCMLFHRHLIERIGNFDSALGNLWSDKDFCYRLSQAEMVSDPDPHRIVIEPRVCVYHHGRVNPETGDWENETDQNTRSLEALRNPQRDFASMQIIHERWGVKHADFEVCRAMAESR